MSLQVVSLLAVFIFAQLLRMILLEDAVNKVEPETLCDAVTAPRQNQCELERKMSFFVKAKHLRCGSLTE